MPIDTQLRASIDDLVTANHILGTEDVLDAFGHVSIRNPNNPESFLMSRARAPLLVEPSDIAEYGSDGERVSGSEATPYIERFIHAAIYEARPEITCVCHNHLLSILPFSISETTPLRAVTATARFLGDPVPVWDIADEFGDGTDLLVRDVPMGRSLAGTLGDRPVALMRGHGSVVVSGDIAELVTMCIGTDRNAKAQLAAHVLGPYTALSGGEIAATGYRTGRGGDERCWEYFKHRATK